MVRLWLTTDNKYVRKSLCKKVKDFVIIEGEKLYIQIRSDIEKVLSNTQYQLKKQ